MKNLFTIVLFVLTLSSCVNYDENAETAKRQFYKYQNELSSLSKEIEVLKHDKELLMNECKTLNILKEGKTPHYVITLGIKQTSYSLDLGEHIKNDLNAIRIEIPVSKDFYDSVDKGDYISNEMRMGSLILRGTFKKIKIKVIDKQLKY